MGKLTDLQTKTFASSKLIVRVFYQLLKTRRLGSKATQGIEPDARRVQFNLVSYNLCSNVVNNLFSLNSSRKKYRNRS